MPVAANVPVLGTFQKIMLAVIFGEYDITFLILGTSDAIIPNMTKFQWLVLIAAGKGLMNTKCKLALILEIVKYIVNIFCECHVLLLSETKQACVSPDYKHFPP